MRQTCPGTIAMDLYTFDTVMLIKSDTNGVYLEIFWAGLWSVNRSNRLWPKDCKRVFYDYFGHVLFLSVFPRRQSIMYNQLPPSCEIETMFTGLASRIITISYNWSLLNRFVVVKMASNCQIVPLAPEKNSDSDSDFSMFTIHYPLLHFNLTHYLPIPL